MKILVKYLLTLKYLKRRQIFFRIFYRFGYKHKVYNININSLIPVPSKPLPELLRSDPSISGYSLTIDDICRNKVPKNTPKLFLYQRFYLNQFCAKKYERIHSLAYDCKRIAYEPYPSSLRLVNAIYAMLQYPHLITDKYLTNIRKDYSNISAKIEYQLDGNHLLENYIALCAYEIIHNLDTHFLKLMKEIKIQFSTDYFHFERSPMYQSILIERLILLSAIMKVANHHAYSDLKEFLEKALNALNFFENSENNLHHFNDSNSVGCLNVLSLQLNFQRIFDSSLSFKNLNNVCGFYKLLPNECMELIVDGGEILADYIPGHSHDAVGTFSLERNGEPFIVNNQVSTYENGEQRYLERSARFHNTVDLSIPLNDVWSSFRVAGRAQVSTTQLKSTVRIKSVRKNTALTRTFSFERGVVSIQDLVVDEAFSFSGRLYFHESVTPEDITKSVKVDTIYCIDEYDRPTGFNEYKRARFITYHCHVSSCQLEILV